MASNEMNSLPSLFDKNDSFPKTNTNSKKSKIFDKANSLISLNKKNIKMINENKLESINKPKIENKNEKRLNKTYSDFFNRMLPNSKSKNNNIINNFSTMSKTNKIIYKKKNKINFSNYYVSSHIFNNKDYISDFISNNHNNNKETKPLKNMKEADNKIEELVKNLNVYTSKSKTLNQSNSQSQKIMEILNPKETEKNNQSELLPEFNKPKFNLKNKFIKKQSEKYLIKGTKIVSPFCDFARDQYLYKKIFYYQEKKKNLKSDKFLDNKLNIIYAENEKQYKQNLIKLNEIYKKIGKNKTYKLEPPQSESKLRALKKRVEFMKRIVDYTYPNMVLTKIREQDKITYEKNKNMTNIVTSKIKRRNYNRFNFQISQGLRKSLSVQKYSFDNQGNKEST